MESTKRLLDLLVCKLLLHLGHHRREPYALLTRTRHYKLCHCTHSRNRECTSRVLQSKSQDYHSLHTLYVFDSLSSGGRHTLSEEYPLDCRKYTIDNPQTQTQEHLDTHQPIAVDRTGHATLLYHPRRSQCPPKSRTRGSLQSS